jgi:HAD superfamily hydrolase (TIGR01509 family)
VLRVLGLTELVAPMIKALFWDNDGVLVETEHLYFQATRHVLETIGVALTEADYIQLFLVEGRGAWHLAAELGVAPRDIERLRNVRNALYGEWLAEAPRLTAGIVQVLDALHGKYVMGVVTSSRKDHFDLIHRTTGLLKYFDFILTADDFRRVKPDPEPYLLAVARSGIDPDACMAIEDSARGLQSATGAGINCIVVPTALTRGCNFAGAHRILDSLGEIPAAL